MKLIIILFLGVVFVQCGENKNEIKPDYLIEKDELISVLIELEIMEAYYEQVHKRPEVYQFTLDSASRVVLSERGLNKARLEQTLNYYSAQPDSLFSLYEQTLDSINKMININ